MNLDTIQAPLGPFRIPAEPKNTRDHAEWICRGVFDGEYEHPDLPTDISTVLDVGSHCGSFALWAEAKWGPLKRVHCFDPNENACRIALTNILTADIADPRDRFRVRAVAVTSDPAPRYGCSWDWGSAKTHEMGPDDGIRVASVHPRDLPAVDLLKCDGEGIEPDVLAHYPHWDGLKALLLEFHSLKHKALLRAACEAHGFRCLREETAATYGPSIWVR